MFRTQQSARSSSLIWDNSLNESCDVPIKNQRREFAHSQQGSILGHFPAVVHFSSSLNYFQPELQEKCGPFSSVSGGAQASHKASNIPTFKRPPNINPFNTSFVPTPSQSIHSHIKQAAASFPATQTQSIPFLPQSCSIPMPAHSWLSQPALHEESNTNASKIIAHSMLPRLPEIDEQQAVGDDRVLIIDLRNNFSGYVSI